MILQDRYVDVRDLLVRDKDEPIVARGKPRPVPDGPELQGVESVSRERHDLDAQSRVAVVVGVAVVSAELLNRLEEAPAEKKSASNTPVARVSSGLATRRRAK